MSAHAPYIMPDGQPLSKYLTFEADSTRRTTRKKNKTRKGKRGKDEIWEHFQRQQAAVDGQQNGYHSEKDEFGIVEKMGNRRRRRWLNDKMLRDMTGPMTRDQMEAQFCPPPWGNDPLPNEPFHLLWMESRGVWEMLLNIDMDKEEAFIEDLRLRTKQKRRNGQEQDSCGARRGLKTWYNINRKLRKLLKPANPMIVLEMELQLLEFKNCEDPESQILVITGQSRYKAMLYEGLCEFHKLKIKWEDAEVSGLPLFNVKITKRRRRQDKIQEKNSSVSMEIICSDLVTAFQEMKSIQVNAKNLKQYVFHNVHGSANGV